MSIPIWPQRSPPSVILDTLPDQGMIAALMQAKCGLQLDRVVLLGRTFEEYPAPIFWQSGSWYGRFI